MASLKEQAVAAYQELDDTARRIEDVREFAKFAVKTLLGLDGHSVLNYWVGVQSSQVESLAKSSGGHARLVWIVKLEVNDPEDYERPIVLTVSFSDDQRSRYRQITPSELMAYPEKAEIHLNAKCLRCGGQYERKRRIVSTATLGAELSAAKQEWHPITESHLPCPRCKAFEGWLYSYLELDDINVPREEKMQRLAKEWEKYRMGEL